MSESHRGLAPGESPLSELYAARGGQSGWGTHLGLCTLLVIDLQDALLGQLAEDSILWRAEVAEDVVLWRGVHGTRILSLDRRNGNVLDRVSVDRLAKTAFILGIGHLRVPHPRSCAHINQPWSRE